VSHSQRCLVLGLVGFGLPLLLWLGLVGLTLEVSQIGTVRYNWPTSAHASQAFSIAPVPIRKICLTVSVRDSVK